MTTEIQVPHTALDPAIITFLEKFIELRHQNMTLTLEEQRKASKQWWTTHRDGLMEVKGVVDTCIPGSYGNIPVRIFLPNARPPFPVIIFFHRGGWVYGSNDECEALCRELVNATDCAVASVEYPLAPENKYPRAVDECYNAIKWIFNHAEEFGGDPHMIILSGESAGGNLAAAAALMARDNGGLQVSGQILICPLLDNSFDVSTYDLCPDKCLMTIENIQWFWQQYLYQSEDGSNQYASPLKAENFISLPSTLILSAQYDPLRTHSELFAAKLKAAGVSVEDITYSGTIHGFIDMPVCRLQASQALQDIRKWLGKLKTQLALKS
ncbi:MAG: alpha/beta hydrolase [Parachlamydiales bacterium]|jgi:acetyl esterase